MTNSKTLLQLAARCRRMAALCRTVAIARKFEALALDYEEHARQMERRRIAVKMLGTPEASGPTSSRDLAGGAVVPDGQPRGP